MDSIKTAILTEQVVRYEYLDSWVKELTAEKDVLNKMLKKQMKELGVTELTAGEIKLTFGIQNRVTVNERKMIELLKNLGFSSAIKLVETVDSDMVEELIYNGQIAPAILEPCNEYKQVETLKVSKKSK